MFLGKDVGERIHLSKTKVEEAIGKLTLLSTGTGFAHAKMASLHYYYFLKCSFFQLFFNGR